MPKLTSPSKVKRRARGRPPVSDPLVKVIGLRLTQQQADTIAAAAARDNRSMSDFIRLAALEGARSGAT